MLGLGESFLTYTTHQFLDTSKGRHDLSHGVIGVWEDARGKKCGEGILWGVAPVNHRGALRHPRPNYFFLRFAVYYTQYVVPFQLLGNSVWPQVTCLCHSTGFY